MNMRDYPTLQLDTNWSKGRVHLLLFYISHSQWGLQQCEWSISDIYRRYKMWGTQVAKCRQVPQSCHLISSVTGFWTTDNLPTYISSPCCARRHIGQGLELSTLLYPEFSTLLYPELSSLFLPRLSPFPLAQPPQFTSKLSLGGPSFFSLLGSILKILT